MLKLNQVGAVGAFKALLVLSTALLCETSFAEVIFYRTGSKIAEVDCLSRTLILNNMYRTQMKIRQPVDEGYLEFCQRLTRFAESSPDGKPTSGAGKVVTLLTVESKTLGDFIVAQEVIGVVDKDYIISAMSVVDHDLVQTRWCGMLNTGSRSQTKICLFQSQAGLYFIEATSVQSGSFSKGTIALAKGDAIVLESRNSKGNVDMTFAGEWSADRKSMTGTVGFGNGKSAVLLKSGY